MSLSLAILHMVIPILFALHQDARTDVKYATIPSTKKAEFKNHCEVCHFVIHQQSQFASGAQGATLIYYAPKPVTIISCFRCKIERSFLPGFTNKGPPLS